MNKEYLFDINNEVPAKSLSEKVAWFSPLQKTIIHECAKGNFSRCSQLDLSRKEITSLLLDSSDTDSQIKSEISGRETKNAILHHMTQHVVPLSDHTYLEEFDIHIDRYDAVWYLVWLIHDGKSFEENLLFLQNTVHILGTHLFDFLLYLRTYQPFLLSLDAYMNFFTNTIGSTAFVTTQEQKDTKAPSSALSVIIQQNDLFFQRNAKKCIQALDTYPYGIAKSDIERLQNVSPQEWERIYVQLLTEKQKDYAIHLTRTWPHKPFSDAERWKSVGMKLFLQWEKTYENFIKYITESDIQNCPIESLYTLLSDKNLRESSKTWGEVIKYKSMVNQRISSKSVIPYIIKTSEGYPYWKQILFFTQEQIREIYNTISSDWKHRDIKALVFKDMVYGQGMGSQFIYDYPDYGLAGENVIPRKSNTHFDVCYSDIYQYFLQTYPHLEEKRKETIQKEVFDKLQGKPLIDLWCGGYMLHTSAFAYFVNASAFVGIDVNVWQVWMLGNAFKDMLIRNHTLSGQVTNNKTVFKVIFDRFEEFLWAAPKNAWYNFTINGLMLTDSKGHIEHGLTKLMKPGNIILANSTENIDIEKLLSFPYKHFVIESIFWSDSLHIFERLSDEAIIL